MELLERFAQGELEAFETLSARTLDLQFPTPALAATVFPIGLVAYYLAWKYLVGFFNELLGIA